ncbi:MAG: NAD(P)-dependent oxidoreductase [Aureispira sp.]|nr:NAD(P)-dependent oxidoreductase [Aureispira sp.]
MKISIIGATSFLGQTLINQLQATSHELCLYSRTNKFEDIEAKWVEYSYPNQPLDYDQLAESSVIFYCAGAGIQPKHGDSDALIYEMNAFEPIRLLSAMQERSYQGKVITFGSYFEIGNQQEEHLYTEGELVSHLNSLPNAYCIAKNMLSRFVYQTIQKEPSFVCQHFVLTNIYGATENVNRLIPYIVQTAAAGKPLEFTSGVQKRQYTHIKDVANFLVEALDNNSVGLFNLTDPTMVSVRELIESVLKTVKKELNISPNATFGTIGRRDLSMKFLGLDVSQLQNKFNFAPKISLEEGIVEYIEKYASR